MGLNQNMFMSEDSKPEEKSDEKSAKSEEKSEPQADPKLEAPLTEEVSVDARFIRPTRWTFKWVWYTLGLILTFSTATLVALIFPEVKTQLDPNLNLILLSLGSLFAFACTLTAISDGKKIQKMTGIVFKEEFIYIHGRFKKLKIRYPDVKKVVFYPVLFSFKKKAGGQAWIRIHTARNAYTSLIPFFEETFPDFEKFQVPVETRRKTLPLLVVVCLLLFFAGAGVPIVLLLLALCFRKFFSKNGFLARGSELLFPVYGIALAVMSLAVIPWSRTDRQVQALTQSELSDQLEEIAKICSETALTDHHQVLSRCASFFVHPTSGAFQNYAKALEFANEALNQAKTETEIHSYADTMACAYMGLGERSYALKVAADYQMPERTIAFSKGEICP
jgi:hypothetical protein